MASTLEKQPPLLSLARNPIEFRVSNISEWGTAAYLVVNLYVETEATSGNFILAEEMEAERDQSGVATFDVSQSLEAHLSYYFSESTSINKVRCPHLCKRYYVEYGYRTGPQALLAEIFSHAQAGSAAWMQMERPFKAGRSYHLLLHTDDMNLAQQVTFRHTDYFGQQTIHAPQDYTPYNGKVHCVFIPPTEGWEFVELNFQEIFAPAGLLIQLYSSYALLEKSEEKYVLLGGWEHSRYPGHAALIPDNRKLLSPQPKVQPAVNGQLMHLYHAPASDGNWSVTVRTRWNDGAVAFSVYDQGTASRYTAYRFALLLENNRLPGYTAGREFDTVEVEINGTLEQTFLRREQATDYIQEVYYANSLGGFDTLICTGKGTDQLETERLTAEVYLPDNYTANQGTRLTYHASGTVKRKFATGPMTKAELEAHLGLFLTKEVRIKVNNTAVPVLILSKQVTRQADGEHLYAFEFEAEYAYAVNEIHPVNDTALGSTPVETEGSLLILNDNFLSVIS
jgi:hypothetical protein